MLVKATALIALIGLGSWFNFVHYGYKDHTLEDRLLRIVFNVFIGGVCFYGVIIKPYRLSKKK